jgi:glutathione S-transferase
MIDLYGFPMSNYYSVVKMAMLEKDVPFRERHEDMVIKTDIFSAGDEGLVTSRPDYMQKSPLGKIPCVGTEHGYLSETQIILEYLEEAYPQVPLLPQGTFARAKARELARILDLHLELQVRRVYAEAFFGGTVCAETKAEVQVRALDAIQAIATLTELSPYAMGPTFTYVDCVAGVHLPIARGALFKLYDIDIARRLPNLSDYLARLAERPSYRISMEPIHGALTALGLRA